MSHSVSSHLSLSVERYDTEIRRFVPHYEFVLGAAAQFVREHAATQDRPRVLDLGAGTGALARAIRGELPAARLTLFDVDDAMLAVARTRFGEGDDVELVRGDFGAADYRLPQADIVVASLSLHHVRVGPEKETLYRRVLEALSPGGLFLNVDAMLPEDGPVGRSLRAAWVEHLVQGGDTREAALARLADWAHEDRYFPIVDELDWMRRAGFVHVDVLIRRGPLASVVAYAPATPTS
ncbi:MAG: class I SAM-dependent methyltransferase [Polyangiaceae bacterium]